MLKALFSLLKPTPDRTFGALISDYNSSRDFAALASTSQVVYGRVLAHLADSFGHDTPLTKLTRDRIERHLRLRTAGAAGDDLKKIRILFKHAINQGWLSADPSAGIKRAKPGRGHHTWTEAEITQFEQRWPIGSRERRALSLLLFTGQRRSDVIRMKWSDISDGVLHLRQGKTGATLAIPLHP